MFERLRSQGSALAEHGVWRVATGFETAHDNSFDSHRLSTESFPDVLSRVCQEVSDALGADQTVLFLYDELADGFSVAASVGTPWRQYPGHTPSSRTGEQLATALHEGEAVVISSGAGLLDDGAPADLATERERSLLLVPAYGSGPVGVLVSSTPSKDPDPMLLDTARRLGREVGGEIEAARPDFDHDCLFRGILESDSGGIAVVEGRDHVFSYAAPTYRNLHDLHAEPFLGRPIRHVLTTGYGERAARLLDMVRTSRRPYHSPSTELTDEYGPQYYELHLLPQVTSDGVVGAIFIVLWPRTEAILVRQALEATIVKAAESQSLLSAVLDNTNNGILFIGRDLTILYANRRVGELFGIEPNRVLGHTAAEVVDAHLAPRMADAEQFSRRLAFLYDHPEETAVDEVEVSFPVPRILERYSAPVYKEDGALFGRIEVYSDVTEVRQLERNKDDFLSLVSHELRTPVTSIKGYAQLLQRRARREQPSEQTLVAYETIERQAARMQELIDLLLDLSRLETGRLTLQIGALNLTELLTRVAAMLQLTTDQHGIRLQVPAEHTWIEGDERRLEQVVTNLLSNAIRYSPNGGTIRVLLLEEDDRICLSIEDEGIGVSLDARSRIFERFYRASGVPQSTGLGIGLYVTKGIVEQHGGTIAVESQVGHGSTFIVTLPRSRREP